MTLLVGQLESASGTEITHILCPHQPAPREGAELKAYLAYITEDRLASAPGVDMGVPINTHQVTDPERGWTLLFDADK